MREQNPVYEALLPPTRLLHASFGTHSQGRCIFCQCGQHLAGRKSFRDSDLMLLGPGLFSLSSSFLHKKGDASTALKIWPRVMQRGLSLTGDCPSCWRGLRKRIIELLIFQENPEDRKSQKIRQGSCAARDGMAGGEPASWATVNQGFKTL